ncbi:DUF1289 domain-containing protein [Epibacterium sp. SM1969]|uniref:DUF1289 domain-containing protein n=1 Tax=Tritonibacter aquimaris TaxID=2663379 RepID=A0A844B1Q9_9RHOB|nr:DUF1289 domain-containing protein [Tritonibacter aquimaris]MQY44272.1 DUF1289 domain-containing protein [Tritonibacter aquimaris]
MNDAIWKRDEIQSPCVKLCAIHPDTGLCTGCARSLDEITSWSKMSDTERNHIIAALPTREAAPQKRRGGRAARVQRAL